MISFKKYILENEEPQEDEAEIFYPGGVYISVNIAEESKIALEKYMELYISNPVDLESLHSTLIYSKKEQKEEIVPEDYTYIGTFNKFSKFGEKEDVLVVEMHSDELTQRNINLVKEYGFISDYDEYKAHITISNNAEDIDINSLPPIDFAIYFEDETVEQLDVDWNKDDEAEISDTMVGKALDKLKKGQETDEKEPEEEKED